MTNEIEFATPEWIAFAGNQLVALAESHRDQLVGANYLMYGRLEKKGDGYQVQLNLLNIDKKKFEKTKTGCKIHCKCDDAIAAATLQNLCQALCQGTCSCCCTWNGIQVCNFNLCCGHCKCENTKDGCCVTCVSGDAKCCEMLQACCDCLETCCKSGCCCYVCFGNTCCCCGTCVTMALYVAPGKTSAAGDAGSKQSDSAASPTGPSPAATTAAVEAEGPLLSLCSTCTTAWCAPRTSRAY